MRLKKLKEAKEAERQAKLSGSGPTLSPAKRRLQKDITDIDRSSNYEIQIGEDMMNFQLIVKPKEGYYKSAVIPFSFSVNENYPHEPPKVKCTKKLYHPNIDLQGNVCLNILRDDWKPVLSINSLGGHFFDKINLKF